MQSTFREKTIEKYLPKTLFFFYQNTNIVITFVY